MSGGIKKQKPTLLAPRYHPSSRATRHGIDPLIHDWEVQEAYRQYKPTATSGSITSHACTARRSARNLHLVMGTMLAHPRTFIMIGPLLSGLDPQELAKQGSLF